MVRKGPFWDVIEGREVPPPAAVLLGWELVSVATATALIRTPQA